MELQERCSQGQELARSTSGAPCPACPGKSTCSRSSSHARVQCVCEQGRTEGRCKGTGRGAGAGRQRTVGPAQSSCMAAARLALLAHPPLLVPSPTVRKCGLTLVRGLSGHASAGALGGAAGGGCSAEQQGQGGGPGGARPPHAPLHHAQGAAAGMLLAGLQDESTSADYPPPHVGPPPHVWRSWPPQLCQPAQACALRQPHARLCGLK